MKRQFALTFVTVIAANSALAQFTKKEPKKEPYICSVRSISVDPNLKNTKVYAAATEIEDNTQIQLTTALYSQGKKRVRYVITRKSGSLEVYATDPGAKPKNTKGETVDRKKVAKATVSDGDILEMAVPTQDQKITCIPETSLKFMDHMKMNSQANPVGIYKYSKPMTKKAGTYLETKRLNADRLSQAPATATN
jgi:hypothetical protein